jgi:5'(3')-deoxyribonucleotidase
MDMDKLIGLDIDGVVANLIPVWLAHYNHDYNDNLKPTDITGWDTDKFVKPECGLKIYDYLKDPHLYDEVLPVDGALDAIKELKADGYRLVYITATPIEASGAKFQWLKRYGCIKSPQDYVEASDKSLLMALGTLVDDKPENLDYFYKKILFGQPWNEVQKYNPKYLYALNWRDVIYYIKMEITNG